MGDRRDKSTLVCECHREQQTVDAVRRFVETFKLRRTPNVQRLLGMRLASVLDEAGLDPGDMRTLAAVLIADAKNLERERPTTVIVQSSNPAA